MLKLRRTLMVGLCFSVILTACAPAQATTSVLPSPSSLPRPTLPPATPVPTSEPAGVGVPALEYKNGQNVLLVVSSIGLQVILVDDGTLVNKIEAEANPTWLSPNGNQIFWSGWKRDNNGTPWPDVYDISSQSIVKHFDGLYLFSTRRLDGKVILVSSNQINENVSYMTSIDPDTLAITGEWKEPANISWLIAP